VEKMFRSGNGLRLVKNMKDCVQVVKWKTHGGEIKCMTVSEFNCSSCKQSLFEMFCKWSRSDYTSCNFQSYLAY
jgi:hypothetical protein